MSATFTDLSPIDGSVLAEVPRASAEDVDRAVAGGGGRASGGLGRARARRAAPPTCTGSPT